MDCRTGEIVRGMSEEMAADLKEVRLSNKPFSFRDEQDKTGKAMKLLLLTDDEHKELIPLSKPKRKKAMRNRACVCGSGKKFKKCCWSKYT